MTTITVPLMCELCGYLGTDVHEQPRYDSVFRRDTTMYVCDDFNACLGRQERSQEEVKKSRENAQIAESMRGFWQAQNSGAE